MAAFRGRIVRPLSIDEFTELADKLAEQVPPRLVEGLNGGIIVSEGARRRPDDPPGVYILGEYITDPYLGRMIVLYYGSFRRLFGAAGRAELEEELWTTIKHELRHHIEGLAGADELEREDAAELARLWKEWRGDDGR